MVLSPTGLLLIQVFSPGPPLPEYQPPDESRESRREFRESRRAFCSHPKEIHRVFLECPPRKVHNVSLNCPASENFVESGLGQEGWY